MELNQTFVPGHPGIPPRWTSSAKSGVGTSLSSMSRAWFTLSHGILNEIYYPRIDQACVRDMGLSVSDGAEFFSEDKRNANSEIEFLAGGVPAFQITSTYFEQITHHWLNRTGFAPNDLWVGRLERLFTAAFVIHAHPRCKRRSKGRKHKVLYPTRTAHHRSIAATI